jgi:uncharacterized membrane protein YfcA
MPNSSWRSAPESCYGIIEARPAPAIGEPQLVISDPFFYLLAIPAVTALGLAKGGFTGLGMISTPLLALVMPPLQAAAILLPILLLQDCISVWVFRKEWDAWNLKVMIPGAAIGMGAAWLLAAHMSDIVVKLLVGLISLAFVLNGWLGRKPPESTGRPHIAPGVFWGSLAGFTSALVQVGAPPYYVYVLPQRLPKMVFVATTAWFFASCNVMKIVPYLSLGQFSMSGFKTSIVLLPLAVATNFLGIWLVRRTPTEIFYKLAYIMMFVNTLELIRQGAMALWRG